MVGTRVTISRAMEKTLGQTLAWLASLMIKRINVVPQAKMATPSKNVGEDHVTRRKLRIFRGFSL